MDEDRPAPSDPGARRVPRRGVRLVAFLALLVATAGVLHAVAIDELLGHRRLIALACRHPERFAFGWERAESPVPGRVHLVNVWFRGRGRKDEWWFRIHEATFSFSPFELPSRRFHVTSLSGSGFAFWWRGQRVHGEEGPRLAESIPPIPGFAPIPYEGEPPWTPPPPGKKFWTIAIDRVALAQLTDLWIDRNRFEGEARVAGRFLLAPHRTVAVGPATLELLSGHVSHDRAPVCDTLRGRVGADIRSFDPRLAAEKKISIWDVTSGSVRLHATSKRPALLAAVLPKGLDARLGATSLGARLNVEKGGEVSGALALDVSGLAFRVKESAVSGHASLRTAVARFGIETGALSLGATSFALKDATVRGPESAADWWLRLETNGLRFAPRDGLRMPLTLSSRDALPILGAVSPRAPAFLRKLVSMEGLVAHAQLRAGPRLLDVEKLDAEGQGARVTGRYASRDGAKSGAILVEKGKLAAALRFEDGKPKWKLLGARKWFAKQAADELPRAGRTK